MTLFLFFSLLIIWVNSLLSQGRLKLMESVNQKGPWSSSNLNLLHSVQGPPPPWPRGTPPGLEHFSGWTLLLPSLPPSWPFCCWTDPTNRDNRLDLPGVSHSAMPGLPFRLMQNNCFPFSRLQLWLMTSRNRSHQAEPFLILQRLSIHLVDQVELLFSFLFPSDFNEFEGEKKKKKLVHLL